MASRSLVVVLLSSVACLALGCGAKTGLDVPDTNVDASSDAGVDASRAAARDVGHGDAGWPCIALDPDGGPIELPLDTEVQITRADVLFLVDTTGTMREEIGHIRDELRDVIAPAIASTILDSEIGVATFADYPVPECGDATDVLSRLLTPMTDDVQLVQASLAGIGAANGLDLPEGQVEALYLTATGEGLGRFVGASFGCPHGGSSYPCFRSDALPVVLMFTDDIWHNAPPLAPGGPVRDPTSTACPAVLTEVVPHSYAQARDALIAHHIRVIGHFSGSDPDARAELDQVARDTHAVDGMLPITFDIGLHGERLSTSVIDSIRTLASVIRLDIDTVLVDPVRDDGVDPRMFVESVTPLRGEPMDGVGGIDVASATFLQVLAGTRVVFQLRLHNHSVAPGVGPQHFLLEIVFRGDHRTRIGSTTVEIVVPGADGSGC